MRHETVDELKAKLAAIAATWERCDLCGGWLCPHGICSNSHCPDCGFGEEYADQEF